MLRIQRNLFFVAMVMLGPVIGWGGHTKGGTHEVGAVRASWFGDYDASEPFQHEVPRPDKASSVSGNVYTNDLIGLTFRFPQDWTVDNEAMKIANAEKPTSTPPSVGGEPKPPVSRTYLLLEVSQRSPKTRIVSGPRIMLNASLVSSSKNETPADRFEVIKRSIETKPNGQVTHGPVDIFLGGETFSRMDLKWVLPSGAFTYEADVAAVRGGYRIAFTILADTPEQLDQVLQTLNSLQFK